MRVVVLAVVGAIGLPLHVGVRGVFLLLSHMSDSRDYRAFTRVGAGVPMVRLQHSLELM